MIYHKQGQVCNVVRYGKTTKYLLFTFYGIFRDSNNVITFKLKKPTTEGHELVMFEVWEAQNLETGLKEIKKFPVYMYQESLDDQLETDRKDYINDNNEVTSLLDDYSCWENYIKTSPPEPKRNGENFHLKIINLRHRDQIVKLKELDSDLKLDKNLRVGVRLKLIQKENPNHLTRRDFLLWKQEFPLLFTKLQEYVYTNTAVQPIIDARSIVELQNRTPN